ncbi:MAG: hypothetical protein CL869_01775 [Cytophagia bacterium]|nr:hypothetical protein [Cytophagia bacterium]|tara:strand:+ start:462 stop:1355 length:894 start_codon:yes stop_codon:yes gene_type:complete
MNILKKISLLKNNYIFLIIKNHIDKIITLFFLSFILYSLSKSGLDLFDLEIIKPIFIYIISSILFTPFLIILTSLRFNFLKKLFQLKANFFDSFNSVLISSSLEVFAPAKLNDFARLANEKLNKKKLLQVLLFEKAHDYLVLFIMIFLPIKYILFVLGFLFILFILFWEVRFLKNNYEKIKSLYLAILLTFIYWLINFSIFYRAFYTIVYGVKNNNFAIDIATISINNFSVITLISLLPINFGGVGLREVIALKILNFNPSIIISSTIIYGVAVSGSVSLIGILYINLKKSNIIKFF